MDEMTERILRTYDTITVVGASRHLGKEARGVPR
jgi:predicted CoA-binding protein